MLNRVVLVGRLTKDPELHYTPSGVAVANFTVAVNRPFKNNGEQEADFINGVVWRKPAENLVNFMKKGNMIGVDGRIQTRNYENQEGKRVFITEVVADSIQFLESKGSGNQGGSQNTNRNTGANTSQQNEDPFAKQGDPIDISDSDLPF